MILVVGESLVDVVDGREHPGGSPLNVAVGLGRLGVDVTLATALGDDASGGAVRAHLAASHVTTQATPTDHTSSARATLDAAGAATYSFDIAWDPGRIEPPRDVVAVHTGSIAAVLAPGANEVLRVVERLQPTAIVSVDPNIRADLIADRADAIDRIERLVSVADLVKASDEDLAWLFPDEEPYAVAERWLADGRSLVVVTRGGDGASAHARCGRLDVPAEPAIVVDTVGAGDAFVSGLLAGLHGAGLLGVGRRVDLAAIESAMLTRIIATATHAAALAVGRTGA